ncbi:MAG: hypothetical protein HY308_15885 [Gammaproteobacteria bacterium]|nr:hypothetical protein [Gammaproteobacteria bacterium]
MKDFLLKQFRALKNSRHGWLRQIVGVLLVACGLVGFLPVLGFWMIPLGLALLAVDFPAIRRLNQRLLGWWERVRRRFSRKKND